MRKHTQRGLITYLRFQFVTSWSQYSNQCVCLPRLFSFLSCVNNQEKNIFSMTGTHSQCIHIPSYHIIHFKCITNLFVNRTLINLEKVILLLYVSSNRHYLYISNINVFVKRTANSKWDFSDTSSFIIRGIFQSLEFIGRDLISLRCIHTFILYFRINVE